MSVKTREEILNSLNAIIGENNSDEVLTLIEDVTDTFTELENQNNDNTNWKEMYENNDKEWREKYRQRFFSKSEDEPDDFLDPEPDDVKPISFNDLFKTE